MPNKKAAAVCAAALLALPIAAGCEQQLDAEEINQYVESLPEWQIPPPEYHLVETLEPVFETDYFDGREVEYKCEVESHDVQSNYNSIMALGDVYSALRPGMILQGNSVIEGTMLPVPLARAPLTLSIDLPVNNPTRHVDAPSSSTLQAAVAELQREAEATLTGLPARITYTSSVVSSLEETLTEVGIDANVSFAIVSAGLDTSFKDHQSARTNTVVVKLFQPMYTISLADDELPEARDFFADELTYDDFMQQEQLGTIGPDNLPTYIQSVTYGRIVLYTMTTEELESGTEFQAALQASFGGFGGVDGETTLRWKNAISSARIQVLALGGFATDVTAAIKSGNYQDLFSDARATSAVPLSYRVNNLKSPRYVATIGDALTYQTKTCNPL